MPCPASIRRTLLYDRKRKPHDWPTTLSHEEVAVFLTDARIGQELTPDGEVVAHPSQNACYVAPNLKAAEDFCRGLIEHFPDMRCEIFDRRGRSVEPLAEFLHPSLAGRSETSPTRARLLITFGLVLLLLSGPLFYLDWRRSGHLLWPSIIAVNCIGVGFRLLYWGVSVLQNRRT